MTYLLVTGSGLFGILIGILIGFRLYKPLEKWYIKDTIELRRESLERSTRLRRKLTKGHKQV